MFTLSLTPELMVAADSSNRRNAYVAYYTAQAGGSLPYYKGAASMRGYGFGSWFMNLFRRAIPIVAPIAKAAASRFISSAQQNLEQGRSLGDSLKQGAIDAGTGALAEGVDAAKKQMRGEGAQKRRAPAKRARKMPVESEPHQRGRGKTRGNISRNVLKKTSASFLDNF